MVLYFFLIKNEMVNKKFNSPIKITRTCQQRIEKINCSRFTNTMRPINANCYFMNGNLEHISSLLYTIQSFLVTFGGPGQCGPVSMIYTDNYLELNKVIQPWHRVADDDINLESYCVVQDCFNKVKNRTDFIGIFGIIWLRIKTK